MMNGQFSKGLLNTPDFVVVDVGLKSEGLIPVNEFTDQMNFNFGDRAEGRWTNRSISRRSA